jgi:quercetin dioxygenase-like cupin family protein
MRKTRLMSVVVLGAASVATAVYVGKARATPASLGFAGTTVAMGRLGEFSVFNQLIQQGAPPWLSLQFTKGASDLYIQNNVWQAGANTGWHSHPGSSLIIVTSGTLADYESSDPACAPTIYKQGMAFVDAGGDHVHNIRNEGAGQATNMAVQLIPAGGQRRVDAPQPANCPVFPPF